MPESGSSFGKWVGGILGTIITGLVLWWLTGPMTPFVHKNTNNGNNDVGTSAQDGATGTQNQSKKEKGNNQTNPVPEEKILVEASPDPYTVIAGEQASINVLAYTGDKNPLENAHVEIGAGGGFFSLSGNHVELGTTNNKGIFKTYWKAPDPAASGYVMGVTVSKDGFINGKTEVTVQVTNH